jgi:peptidoglycan/LPS O-acetylase OafA/YrhL
MQCRNCGTEIAEKAIVCYRCGAATTDPVRKPVTVRPRSNPLWSFAAITILLLAALYLGQASRTAADPERWQTAAGVLVGAAIVVLVLRLVRRRQRM